MAAPKIKPPSAAIAITSKDFGQLLVSGGRACAISRDSETGEDCCAPILCSAEENYRTHPGKSDRRFPGYEGRSELRRFYASW